MKSFYNLYSSLKTKSADESTAQVAEFKQNINDTQGLVLSAAPWPFLEYNGTKTTIDGTNYYQIPNTLRKINTVIVTTAGGTIYRPTPIEDAGFWNYLLSLNSGESDVCQYYYRLGNLLYLYPTPATTGSTITIKGRKRGKELSQDDYTTGTIVTATITDESIVGSGSSWLTRKPCDNQFLRIDGVTGDYRWYEISSITSDTALELVKPYEGASIAAGTETYTIGEFSLIPEQYHDLMIYRPLALYFSQNEQDVNRADRYFMLYDGGFERGLSPVRGGLLGQMLKNELQKNEGMYLDPSPDTTQNINDFRIDDHIGGESW